MKTGISSIAILFTAAVIYAAKPAVNFNGIISGLGQISNKSSSAHLRYIPVIDAKLAAHIDLELSGNFFTFINSGDLSGMKDNLIIKHYRNWIRYSTAHLEFRLGLQKINFGPGKILRSLRWFDSLDPTDPLQISEGVYALRLKYDFLNNANFWFWGLYGNQDLKGWERYATRRKTPEFGGRIQFPVGNGELALTSHHRSTEPDGDRENRLALDGFWDAGLGLWFESAIIESKNEDHKLQYQTFLTLGTDYTFPLGTGLTAAAEHLLISSGSKSLSQDQDSFISSISLFYSIGIMDRISIFSFYVWDSNQPAFFLSWQRTYDNWMLQISTYRSINSNPGSFSGDGSGEIGNQGMQFTWIFNH